MNIEQVAATLYDCYREQVGGRSVNGEILPDWKTFRVHPDTKTQSDAWIVVAQEARNLFERILTRPAI